MLESLSSIGFGLVGCSGFEESKATEGYLGAEMVAGRLEKSGASTASRQGTAGILVVGHDRRTSKALLGTSWFADQNHLSCYLPVLYYKYNFVA